MSLRWDEKVIPKELDGLDQGYVRDKFRKVFIQSSDGREVLAMMAVMFHWADPELVTQREIHMRNAFQKLLALCGVFDDVDTIKGWLDIMQPIIDSVEKKRMTDAERAVRHIIETGRQPDESETT